MQHRALSAEFQRYLKDCFFGNSDSISLSGSRRVDFQCYKAQISQGGFSLRFPRCTVLLYRDQPSGTCRPIRLRCEVNFTGSIIKTTDVSNPAPIIQIYDGNFISVGSQEHDLDDIMNGLVLPFTITEMNKVCVTLRRSQEH